MKHKKFVTAGILVITAALVTMGFRYSGLRHCGHPGMMAERFERISEELSLTDAQQAQMGEMQTIIKNDIAKFREKKHALLEDINVRLNAQNPDIEAILEYVKNIIKDKPNPALKRLNYLSEFISMLDDEQKDRLIEKIRGKIKKIQERMEGCK